MNLSLSSSVQYIPHVGPVMAGRLKRLDITTVEELLYHIPFRYDDFTLISPIARVQPGETVTVTGTVENMKMYYTKTGKKIQEGHITDSTGTLTIIWFNQVYLMKVIRPGATIHVSGPISWFGNKIVMNSPQYEITSTHDTETSLHTGRLVPIYPETEGVSSKWLRSRISFLITYFVQKIQDFLPLNIRSKYDLMELEAALRVVHFPKTLKSVSCAKRRLAFDELFLLQLRSFEQKHIRETTQKARRIFVPKRNIKTILRSLPFLLTNDQNIALTDLLADLSRSVPTNRLLEGDVGSGKTVVAALAMYAAFANGYQAVLMAPTQILAEQHFNTIQKILSSFRVPVHLVTSSIKTITKFNKQPSVVIGTHALLSDTLQIPKLALVVVDEQHRFVVEQRAKLTGNSSHGFVPHLLTMTATPIPRTLAKTVFGNLDLSVLNEMPQGRKKIKTWVIPEEKRKKAYAWIRKQITDTHAQVFIICPLINESETLTEVKAVNEEYKTIQLEFPNITVGLLHGKMSSKEKTKAIEDFRNNRHSILVATPVVEVGIDIPNATIILIEAADRFGLGQLHQLRGRVGRSTLQSYCLLFTQSEDEKAIKRLRSLEIIFDGPTLAERDLVLRGPGEIFGVRQHGVPNLKIAAFSDIQTISDTHAAAEKLMKEMPDLSVFPLLREKVKNDTIESVQSD